MAQIIGAAQKQMAPSSNVELSEFPSSTTSQDRQKLIPTPNSIPNHNASSNKTDPPPQIKASTFSPTASMILKQQGKQVFFNLSIILLVASQTAAFILLRTLTKNIYKEKYSSTSILAVTEFVKYCVAATAIVFRQKRSSSNATAEIDSKNSTEESQFVKAVLRTSSQLEHDLQNRDDQSARGSSGDAKENELAFSGGNSSSSKNKDIIEFPHSTDKVSMNPQIESRSQSAVDSIADNVSLLKEQRVKERSLLGVLQSADLWTYYKHLARESGAMILVAVIYLVMNLLSFFAMTWTDGTTIVLIFQLKVATTAVVARIWLKRTFSTPKLLGIALILIGVVEVSMRSSPQAADEWRKARDGWILCDPALSSDKNGGERILQNTDISEESHLSFIRRKKQDASAVPVMLSSQAEQHFLLSSTCDDRMMMEPFFREQNLPSSAQPRMTAVSPGVSERADALVKQQRTRPPSAKDATAQKEQKKAQAMHMWFLGVGAVFIEIWLSGLNSVFMEVQFKKQKAAVGGATLKNKQNEIVLENDIWDKNFQLALCSCPIYLILEGVERVSRAGWDPSEAFSALFRDSLFVGWTPWSTCLVPLGALGGFLVAIALRYADAIIKCMATSVAIVMVAVCNWVWLDGPMDSPIASGCLTVILATFVYQL